MLDGVVADPKVAVLRLGGIDAKAAIDTLATAGHPGQFGNDQPGGAGFRRGEGQFVVGQVAGDSVEQFHCVFSWGWWVREMSRAGTSQRAGGGGAMVANSAGSSVIALSTPQSHCLAKAAGSLGV